MFKPIHYNKVKKVVHDGITFDSLLERDCYLHHRLLEKAKEIFDFKWKPKAIVVTIKGERVFEYRPDCSFVRGDKVVVMDAKGFLTPTFRLKWKIVKAIHSDVLFELWTAADRRKKK